MRSFSATLGGGFESPRWRFSCMSHAAQASWKSTFLGTMGLGECPPEAFGAIETEPRSVSLERC